VNLEKRLPNASLEKLKRIQNRLVELREHVYLQTPLKLELTSKGELDITIAKESQTLGVREWSHWFTIPFQMSPLLTVYGMARIRVLAVDPPELYMTPVQFHPHLVPHNVSISSPPDFAGKIAQRIGLYPTLGWAEATNALKDEQIDDYIFWEDLQYSMKKAEELFFTELDKKDWQLFLSFFYAPDRAGHMFWRFIDARHPRHQDIAKSPELRDAMLHVYQWMDRVVGKAWKQMDQKRDIFMVVSDHGFAPFRWEVNLNTWLHQNGYLTLKEEQNQNTRFQVVDLYEAHNLGKQCDWAKTRAYAMGLGGIFINVKGREPEGIVLPGKPYQELCEEIRSKLMKFPLYRGEKVIEQIYLRHEIYKGSWVEEAPDIIIGFCQGYRVSWQTSLGAIPPHTIEPNLLKWSGDHCSVAPTLIPGVLFCNRPKLKKDPCIEDIAPTILSLFHIQGNDMDGKALID
jgi:predicted AlkP superfamily phosphohydrolase/phosphomutase